MQTASDAVVDRAGRTMFFCSICGADMTRSDFFEIGLRLPDAGESRDEFADAELIDTLTHTACLRASRGSQAG